MSAQIMSRLAYHVIRKTAGVATVFFEKDQLLVQQGTTYNRISEVLGEDEYNELSQDQALEVEEIFYCQEELGGVKEVLLASRKALVSDFDGNLRKKRLINHDFVMLKLRPGAPDSPAIYISAEKVGAGDGSKAGIYITVTEKAEEIKQLCCLRRIKCCSQIGLLELIAILKKKSPDYDIQHDNCWYYAEKTTEFLLQACIERKTNESEDQRRLQKELEDLKANLFNQHVRNTVERAANTVKRAVETVENRVERATNVWEKFMS